MAENSDGPRPRNDARPLASLAAPASWNSPMRWILIRAGAVLGRGSRETVLTLAEHHGLVWHATSGHSPEPGRGYQPDGTELAARLVQGALILPEAMLPARVRRRAA